MTYVEYIPSMKNLSLASLKEAVTTSIVTVKNELSSNNEEPEELKPRRANGEVIDLVAKQTEVEANLQIMQ